MNYSHLQNIEESEQVEQEAIQHSRRLAAEELLIILAHDLKNYLTPLKVRLSLLKQRALAEKREKDIRDLEAIEKTERRFESMIKNLLDVARLKQNILLLNYQTCDLAQIIREVAEPLSSPTTTTEIQGPHTLMIWADADRIYQLLENLVANALEHAILGSRVLIQLEECLSADEKSHVQVAVQNYGKNIPLALREQLFQPFQSGENSRGLGLGLYLARSIALAHQGDIVLDDSVNDGARFLLKLPIKRG